MAEALVEKVMKVGGVENYEIVETHPGSFFENMLADHPCPRWQTAPRSPSCRPE